MVVCAKTMDVLNNAVLTEHPFFVSDDIKESDKSEVAGYKLYKSFYHEKSRKLYVQVGKEKGERNKFLIIDLKNQRCTVNKNMLYSRKDKNVYQDVFLTQNGDKLYGLPSLKTAFG